MALAARCRPYPSSRKPCAPAETGDLERSLSRTSRQLLTVVVGDVRLNDQATNDHDANIAFCQAHNIAYEAWNVVKGCNRTHPTVVSTAAKHNVSAFQVCLRYIVDRGCVMAVGTGKDPSTVGAYTSENLRIFEFKLTDEEVDALSAI